MKIKRFLTIVIVVLFSAHIVAKDNPFIKVGFRNGDIGVFEFLKYDKKKLRFELRQNDHKQKIKINQLSFIQFDTSVSSPTCDYDNAQVDFFNLKENQNALYIFRKMDKKKVTYVLSISSENEIEIPIESLNSICFNLNVLNIDRFEYGKGFNLLSKDEEIELGIRYAEEIFKSSNVLDDTLVGNYIDSLGTFIAQHSMWPELKYSFTVINDDVINAFTTGGGQIFLYRGLIERMGSESELAGVIAHEIGHSVGHHTSKQLSKKLLYGGILELAGGILNKNKNEWAKALTDVGGVVAFFGLMKYGRDDEREADFLGFYNLYNAGIHPNGMISLFETFSKLSSHERMFLEEWVATHPSAEERKENVTDEQLYIDAEGLVKDSERFQWIKEYLSALPPPEKLIPFWVDTFDISAGHYSYKEFIYDEQKYRNCRFFGRFLAQVQNDYNDIKFYIMDEVNFVNWTRDNKSTHLLNTEKTSIYDLDFKLSKPGKYYLIFDNSYSIMTSKIVVTAIYLGFTKR